MKILPFIVGAIALCAVSTAHAQKSISSSDSKFATKAAASGLAEVAEGKMAADKTGDPQVKQFAQQMVTDHSKANDQLTQIATGKSLSLPMEPTKRDQAKANKLEKMSGAAFDKNYIAGQIVAHKQAVALFKRESERGKDPDLKQFATQTLPILEHHLQMAESLKGAK